MKQPGVHRCFDSSPALCFDVSCFPLPKSDFIFRTYDLQKNIVKDRITSFTFSYVVKGHPPSHPPTQAVGHEGESVSFQINPCLINTFLLFKEFNCLLDSFMWNS